MCIRNILRYLAQKTSTESENFEKKLFSRSFVWARFEMFCLWSSAAPGGGEFAKYVRGWPRGPNPDGRFSFVPGGANRREALLLWHFRWAVVIFEDYGEERPAAASRAGAAAGASMPNMWLYRLPISTPLPLATRCYVWRVPPFKRARNFYKQCCNPKSGCNSPSIRG